METERLTQGQAVSEKLVEVKAEATEKKLCTRCLVNGRVSIEVKDGFCPNCGAEWTPKI